MPVTDEYLKLLEDTSPEERGAHFDALEPEKRQEVLDAVKARKTSGVSVGIGTPKIEPSVDVEIGTPEVSERIYQEEPSFLSKLGDFAGAATSKLKGTIPDAVTLLAKTSRMAASQYLGVPDDILREATAGHPQKLVSHLASNGIDTTKAAMDLLNAEKERYVTPVVRGVQHAIYEGGLGSTVDSVQKIRNVAFGAVGGDPKELNLLERQALSTFGGPEILSGPGYTERDKAEAEHGLVEAFGPHGAQAALVGADIAGQLPLFLIGGGAGGAVKAAETAPFLTRLILGVGKGAGVGAGVAVVTPGQQIEEGAAVGAAGAAAVKVGGAVLRSGGAVLQAGKKRVIGLITSDGLNSLGREVAALQPGEVIEGLPVENAKLRDFRPTMATVYVKDGKPIGRLAEVNPNGNKLQVRDFPLETPAQVNEFAEAKREFPTVKSVSIPPEVLRDPAVTSKPFQWTQRVFEGPQTPTKASLPEYRLNTWGADEAPALGEEGGTNAGRLKRRVTPSASRPLDAPPASPSQGPHLISETPNGISAEPMATPDIGRRPGDLPVPGEMAVSTSPTHKTVLGKVGRTINDKTELLPPGASKPVLVDSKSLAVATPEAVQQAHADVPVEALKSPTPEQIQASSGLTLAQSHEAAAEIPTRPAGGADVFRRSGAAIQGGSGAPDTAHQNIGKVVEEFFDAPKSDDLVYIKEPNGKYTTAKVVSVNGGKATMDVGPGKAPRVVDANSLWPASRGIADPKTMVPAQPPTGPVPAPGTLPPHLANQFSAIDGLLSRFRQSGFFDKARRALFGQGLTGPQDLTLKVQAMNAAKALQDTSLALYKSMRQALGKEVPLLSAFDKDFLAYAKGAGNDMSKYGPAWDRFKDMAHRMLGERDALDKKIAQLGGIPEELVDLRESGVLDRYIARSYLSYVMKPGQWAKLAPPEVRQNAIDFLLQQAKKEGLHISPHEVALNLHEVMRARDSLGALQSSPVMQRLVGKNLTKLQDIPGPLRAAMGEVESGTYRLAQSLGSQRAIAAHLEAMSNIVSDKRYYSPGPRADLHPVPLPNDLRAFGNAAGGYVHPDIYDAAIGTWKGVSSGPAILHTLQGFMKGNLVGANPGAILHHNMANVWHAYLSGGFDPFGRPLESGRALVDAWKALRAYGQDASGAGPGALALEAKRFGALRPGFGSQEIQGIREGFANHFQKQLAGAGAIPDAWSFLGAFNKAATTYKGFLGDLGHAYDFLNDVSKLASYGSLRRKFAAQGLSLPEAAEKAAYRINLSYPDPSNLGPAVQKLRGTVGVAAPFLSPIAEEARIHSLLPKRLLDEPDLRWRMAQAGIAGLAMFGAAGAARRLNGIPDEEVEAGLAELTRRQRNYRPALAVAPWRDSEGRLKIYDLTHFSYLSRLFEGNPDDAMWRRVFGNLITAPLAEGQKEAADRALEKAGLIHPLSGYQPMTGDSGLLKFMEMTQRSGFGAPQVLTRALDSVRKGGLVSPLSPTAEKWTPAEMAEHVAGSPFAMPVTVPKGDVGSPSMLGAVREDRAMMSKLKAELHSAAKSGDQERVKEVLDRIRAIAENAGQRGAKVEAAGAVK